MHTFPHSRSVNLAHASLSAQGGHDHSLLSHATSVGTAAPSSQSFQPLGEFPQPRVPLSAVSRLDELRTARSDTLFRLQQIDEELELAENKEDDYGYDVNFERIAIADG